MNKINAVIEFKCQFAMAIRKHGKTDKPFMRQLWNDWTDHMCKSGQITERQYQTWLPPKFIK